MDVDKYFEDLHREMCTNGGCGTTITLVAIIVIFLLCGCKQIEYVPVIEHHTDTTYITKWRRDSVWKHDSIRVSEKGDTIKIEKWHTEYVEKQVHDTLYQAKTDSIPVPYEVPAKLSKWQQMKVDYGGWAMGILAFLVVFFAATSGFWKRIVKVIRTF